MSKLISIPGDFVADLDDIRDEYPGMSYYRAIKYIMKKDRKKAIKKCKGKK